jgi:hypothetical protein
MMRVTRQLGLPPRYRRALDASGPGYSRIDRCGTAQPSKLRTMPHVKPEPVTRKACPKAGRPTIGHGVHNFERAHARAASAS